MREIEQYRCKTCGKRYFVEKGSEKDIFACPFGCATAGEYEISLQVRFESDIIIDLLKGMGWEYYGGQSLLEDEAHHFISKDKELITVIVEYKPYKEILEAIRGD